MSAAFFVAGLALGAILGHAFLPPRIDRAGRLRQEGVRRLLVTITQARIRSEDHLGLDLETAYLLAGLEPSYQETSDE